MELDDLVTEPPMEEADTSIKEEAQDAEVKTEPKAEEEVKVEPTVVKVEPMAESAADPKMEEEEQAGTFAPAEAAPAGAAPAEAAPAEAAPAEAAPAEAAPAEAAPAEAVAPAETAAEALAPAAEAGTSATAAATASKEEVLARLRAILPTVDMEKTSEKMLRKRLEEEFGGVDLLHMKADMRSTIEAYLDEQAGDANGEDGAGGGEDAEGEEEGDEKPAEGRGARRRSGSKAASKDDKPKEKRKAGGFASVKCPLSPALAEFLGVEEESRPQVVKRIWAYVKENNLQDPKDKRKIKCDEKMQGVFPPTVTMFNMNKFLSKHIFSAGDDAPRRRRKGEDEEEDEEEDGEDGEEEGEEEEEDDGTEEKKAKKPKKEKAPKKEKKETKKKENEEEECGRGRRRSAAPKPKDDKPKEKRKGGGFASVKCPLSPALAELLGVAEETRPQVVKRIWDYIRANNLQDPSNKRNIKCDEKMQGVFPASITMFNMNKYLTKHIYPAGSAVAKDADDEEEEDGAEEEEEEEEGDEPPAKRGKTATKAR